VSSISLPARPAPGALRSKRLLALAGDDRLVQAVRAGSEQAFEVAFERHGPGILGFCRHMLGSREEGEDVVQHTFAAAHRSLLGDDRAIALKPWLYAIARNRCLSLLRARREEPVEAGDLPTAGLGEQVERRAELRELLADVAELPPEQRSALLLAELGDLSHAEVARVLDCEVARVKGLVYRARHSLIERRDARDTPCEEIRVKLANLSGGALRRAELRDHLRGCAGCREFRERVRQQRGMLAVALPVVPSAGLKSSVLAAAGLGGSASGGTALAALGGAGGGALGSATVAKVAIVGVLAGGGAVAGERLAEREAGRPAGSMAPAERGPAAPRSDGPASRAGPDRGGGPARSASGRGRIRQTGAAPAARRCRTGPRARSARGAAG
jgi:RNA polymerase sigma factor (sigma-70 family)